jgi:hypothetical protein
MMDEAILALMAERLSLSDIQAEFKQYAKRDLPRFYLTLRTLASEQKGHQLLDLERECFLRRRLADVAASFEGSAEATPNGTSDDHGSSLLGARFYMRSIVALKYSI